MKKQQKKDFLVILSHLSQSAVNNAEAILKTMNGLNAEAEKPDEGEIKAYIERLEKTYFTPAEREDLFLITSKLWSLCDKTSELYKKIKNTDIFKISDSERKNASVLKSVTEKCLEMTIAFSNIPKCDNITELYFSVIKICRKPLSSDVENDICICLKLCRDTADAIYYSYLKNT